MYSEDPASIQITKVVSTSLESRIWKSKATEWPTTTSNQSEFNNNIIIEGNDNIIEENSYYRPYALYIHSNALAKMDEPTILSYLNSLINSIVPPLGLEWIDDQSIVLLFSSSTTANDAFLCLTGNHLDILNPLELTYFKGEENTASPFQVRGALATDVRAKNAASKSTFYANQRANAASPYSQDHRRNDRRALSPASEAKRLDDELNNYLAAGDEADNPTTTKSYPSDRDQDRRGGRQPKSSSSRWERGGKSTTSINRSSQPRSERSERGVTRTEREPRGKREVKTVTDLDAELDAYLNSSTTA